MDANHSKLLGSNQDQIYENDLIYENDNDRNLLWLHLHQWVFAKAFDDLRRLGDTSEARVGALKALQEKLLGGATFVVPDRVYAPTVSTEEEKHGKVVSSEHEISTKSLIATKPTKPGLRKRMASFIVSTSGPTISIRAPVPSFYTGITSKSATAARTRDR